MRVLARRTFLLGILLATFLGACADSPEQNFNGIPMYGSYEEAGFATAKIETARRYMESAGPVIAAAVVIFEGKVLLAWGDIEYPYKCHSVRKGLLSSLYGIHATEGNIDLESALAQLGIDDSPPLTEAEKEAKVIHLLRSRSGVYHPAAAETSAMAARRPDRGSHAPDTFHYYNNWDFNVLGTIFEQQTGKHIFEEFEHRIAGPIGMQDFDPDECFYSHEREHSEHPAYFFRMSTRDRARFGLLYLRKGNWNGTQLVAEDWVRNCMAEHSPGLHGISGLSAGIMWGIIEENSEIYRTVQAYQMIEQLRDYDFYMLTGDGGQIIGLVPELDLVLAISGDTEHGAARAGTECIQLLDMILRARMG
jgi:CubicO group peptidase (beta-lactamase class C family)